MQASEQCRVEGLVAGVRRDGKNRYRESAKQAVIALCRLPGASVSAIAVANGINPNVVRRWLSLADADQSLEQPPPAALLPVMLATEEADCAQSEPSTVSVRSPKPGAKPIAHVEFCIEYGTATVRFTAPLEAGILELIAASLTDR